MYYCYRNLLSSGSIHIWATVPVPGLRDRLQLQLARHCGRPGLRVQVVPHLGPVYPQPHAQARGAPSLHRVQPSGIFSICRVIWVIYYTSTKLEAIRLTCRKRGDGGEVIGRLFTFKFSLRKINLESFEEATFSWGDFFWEGIYPLPKNIHNYLLDQ